MLMKGFTKKQSQSYMLILLILISMTISSFDNTQNINANPIYIDYLTHGALLPINYTHGIIMKNAEVTLNIDADRSDYTALIDYSGNYTFYNTNNTQNLIIAAPFAYDLYEVEGKITVLVDNVQINFSLIIFHQIAENFTHYLPNWNYIHFIVCNITFQANMTTNVFYEFDSLYTSIGYDTTHIEYIVGTANSWDNSSNINEIVEFRVTGFQPKGYSENCTVSKIQESKSYLWKWENEQIDAVSVGIFYRHSSISPVALIAILGATLPIFLTLLIYVAIKLVRKSKKK